MANDVERIARIMNSNTQLPLSPYEQSLVVKELAGFNLSPDEIAALVGKSRATVDKLLAFSQANHDVQTLVREGSVAVDAAVDRVKEHGEAAGPVTSKRPRRQARRRSPSPLSLPYSAPPAHADYANCFMTLPLCSVKRVTFCCSHRGPERK